MHPFGGPFTSGSQFGTTSSQTTPAFGMASAFGASSTSAFGASTGSSLFGNPSNNNNSSNPNRPNNAFGGNTGGSLFASFGQGPGQTPQNNPSPHAGTTPFGQPSAFGGGGGSPQQPTFGQGATTFGNNANTMPRFGGSFGSGTTLGGGDGSQGTYGVCFEKVLEPDSTQSSRSDGAGRSYLISIAAMRQFVNETPDTLRAIDYKKGHKRQSRGMQNPFGGGMGNSTPGPGLFSGSGGGGGGGFGMNASSGAIFGNVGGGFGSAATTSSGLFAQSTTNRFGYNSTGTSPSAFGSNTGSGFGMNTGASIFGSNTTPAFGTPQTGTSLFANASSPSLFGNNQTSTGFGTGLGQSTGGGFGGSGPGIFGNQASTGAMFGRNTSPGFGGQAQAASLFQPGNTTGSSFTFNVSSTGLFSNPQTGGGLLFAPPQSTGPNVFGYQSSMSLFNTGSSLFQNPSTGFGNSALIGSNPQGGNTGQQSALFAPSQPFQQPPPGAAPENYFAVSKNLDPSTHPNWTPAYGIVAPNLNKYEELIDGQTNLERVDRFQYMKSKKTRVIPVPYPVRYVLEEKTSGDRNQERSEPSWSTWATVAKPSEPSMEQKLEQWVDNIKKKNEASHVASSSSDAFVVQSAMTQRNVDVERQEAMAALVQAEESRRHATSGASNVSNEELEALLPRIWDGEYYTLPSVEALRSMVLANGRDALKRVYGVEIGRRGYGKIVFSEPVNLEALDVMNSVVFKRGNIAIPEKSPLKGFSGTVTLFKVFTKQGEKNPTQDGMDLTSSRMQAKSICASRGYTFCSFERDGTWVFKIG